MGYEVETVIDDHNKPISSSTQEDLDNIKLENELLMCSILSYGEIAHLDEISILSSSKNK
jgi:hypothetical protein